MPNISKFALKDGKIAKSMSKIKSFTSCFSAFRILLLGISHSVSCLIALRNIRNHILQVA